MTEASNDSSDEHVSNLVHAAATWMERIGANDQAAVVVTIAPRAALGVWTPGDQHVKTLQMIDDAGAEICEAAAPVVQRGLETLPYSTRYAAREAIRQGARLQLLVMPAVAKAVLRIVNHDQAVVLTTCELAVPV